MSKYIDGFVLPLPKDKIDRYTETATKAAVNAKVMADPRIKEMCDPETPIFDCTRMAYGGFRTIIS